MGHSFSHGLYAPVFTALAHSNPWTPKLFIAPPICSLNSTSNTTNTPSLSHELSNREIKGSNESVVELCSRYGHLLDRQIAQTDTLYALHPLFKLAAATEQGFLSLLDARLDTEFEPSVLREREFNLSTLLHTKNSLFRRIETLKSCLLFLKRHDRLQWATTSTSDDARTVTRTREDICMDFEELLSAAAILSNRFTESIALIQAVTTVKQAERALEESQSLKSLTKLAFIFVPMSFVTSFLGMNVREFSGQNSQSIWLFFVVAVPLTVVAFTPLLPRPSFDVGKWVRRWKMGRLERDMSREQQYNV
ncbi:hypothetical protein DM02DRAFT_671784 [Periconia macrospinosa]|uniref:Mg2+ transporter protein n=1 Tax=Periconia macrospinosa TaxID=97972 RepID=A0A2V1DRL7_9PLEO|nr:hypothetical protein DM02DRAFT_671784 [Periconia macrospinosa]